MKTPQAQTQLNFYPIESGFTKRIRAYGSVSDETMINFEDTRGVASVGSCNHGLQSVAMKQ